MLSTLLGKISGSIFGNEHEYKELVHRISKMNLTQMRDYTHNKIADFKVNEDGITEIMKRLVQKDEKTSKLYLQPDDMDSKIKKCMELVLNISEHKNINVVALEKIQIFIDTYADIIEKYDKDNKEIYASKLKKALSHAIGRIDAILEINNKINVTKQ